MKWFSGSIPEAIAQAKSQSTLFVVFIFDETDASQSIFDALDSSEVNEIVSSKKFVAIKLENGKEEAKQFSEIYPLVVVPSLYFINSETGVPIELVAGTVTSEILLDKVKKLPSNPSASDVTQQAAASMASPPATSIATPAATSSPLLTTKSQPEEAQADKSSPGSSQAQGNDSVQVEATKDKDPVNELSLGEKVNNAKQLLVEKQKEKEIEEKEAEKKREIERRKTGQEIIKSQQKRAEKETLAAASSYRKEKQEDILAREEVKRRIQADRDEREARAAIFAVQQPQGEAEPAKKKAFAPSTSDSRIARIKFRLPDGSSLLHQFPDDAPLSQVQQYVRENSNLQRFNMTSTVHQRSFSAQDMETSLRDLGLLPSAMIIISPGPKTQVSLPTPTGGLMSYIWYFLTPISVLWTFVQSLIGIGPASDVPSSSNTEKEIPKPKTGSETTRNRPKTAYGRRHEPGPSRQEGNIHRFQNEDDNDDDDEEKKTWNGNSTQQL